MTEGFSMVFSNQFLMENAISLQFIDNLNLFQNYGQSPPLTPDEEHFAEIERFAVEIFKLFNSQTAMKFLSIGAFLKLLLIECNTLCAVNPIEFQVESASNKILKSFKNTVDSNFKKNHSVAFCDKRRIVPREKANLATLQFTFSKKMPQNFIFKGLKNVSDLFPF